MNKNNARGLLEDGLFSRFERRLLTEEELKAKLSAPKEARALIGLGLESPVVDGVT